MIAPIDEAERARLRREGEAGDPDAWFELGLLTWHAGGPNHVPLARAIRAETRAKGLRAEVVATETERAFYWLVDRVRDGI